MSDTKVVYYRLDRWDRHGMTWVNHGHRYDSPEAAMKNYRDYGSTWRYRLVRTEIEVIEEQPLAASE